MSSLNGHTRTILLASGPGLLQARRRQPRSAPGSPSRSAGHRLRRRLQPGGATAVTSANRIDLDFEAPVTTGGVVGLDRELRPNLALQVAYTYNRTRNYEMFPWRGELTIADYASRPGPRGRAHGPGPAFVLRDVEGLATEEICKILDVSRTNLGVMLYRVRNRLRECLECWSERRWMTITCREFSRLVASDEIAGLSFWRRLEARVHVWLCRHCHRYQKELLSLGSAARRAWGSPVADAAGTDALEKRILERIADSQREADPDTKDGAEPGS